MTKKLYGPDGSPLPLKINGRHADMSADAVHERFWRRSPGEYEHCAQRVVLVARALAKSGIGGSAVAETLREAALLLAEVYVAKRDGAIGRS